MQVVAIRRGRSFRRMVLVVAGRGWSWLVVAGLLGRLVGRLVGLWSVVF